MYAHALGCAEEVLDRHGGSDIFQTSPARVEFTGGVDQLACLNLKPGALMRWYAACCDTPIGNTMANPRMSFVGLVHLALRPEGGASLDDVLGPVRGHVQVRFAQGDASEVGGSNLPPPSMILRFGKLILGGRLRGDHRHSPFFDAASGEPRVVPRVLSREEHASVAALVHGE